MLMLARNTLGNNFIFESDERFIRWDHIKNLHGVQKELFLKFSNQLSSKHINWKNSKIKVSYAESYFQVQPQTGLNTYKV